MDRRVQHTRQLLRSALIQLIQEKGYDDVTIQDITDKANLGRTTFYLHYDSKEALLLDHHLTDHLNFATLNQTELLGDQPHPEIVAFLTLLTENRRMYYAISTAKEATVLLKGIRDQMVANLHTSLIAVFPGIQPRLPLEVLLEYIVGAQLALVHWWMTTRTPYEARQIATMLHQLQRAAIRDAYQ